MLRSKRLMTALLGCCVLSGGIALAEAAASTDSEIDQRVTDELRKVSPDAARQIHVETNNGVVTLSGYVDSSSREQQVLRAVKHTDGVTDVHNELRVKM
jgi:hyperosmotically inducible periplasmic protein